MKNYRPLYLCVALLAAVPAPAQLEVNSEPVAWSDVRIEGAKLALDGVFAVTMPDGGQWKKLGATTGPTGSPVNMWEGRPAHGTGLARLIIMDVVVDKVPEAERAGFTPAVAKAFRRTGIEALQRKGYTLEEFTIEEVEDGRPHSVRAVSRFTRGQERRVDVTYFLPAGRLYIVGYENSSDEEPSWFPALLKGLEYR